MRMDRKDGMGIQHVVYEWRLALRQSSQPAHLDRTEDSDEYQNNLSQIITWRLSSQTIDTALFLFFRISEPPLANL